MQASTIKNPILNVKQQSHIDSLTGIRAILMFSVLLYHIQLFLSNVLFPEISRMAVPIIHLWIVVDMFFILSGFIIAFNYEDDFSNISKAKLKRYLISRIARVFPAHIITTLLLFFVLLIVFGVEPWKDSKEQSQAYIFMQHVDFSIAELFKTLLLVQAWTLPTKVSWNTVSWSVSAEWFAYLLFPFFVMFIRLFSFRAGYLLFLFLLVYISGIFAAFVSINVQGFSHVGIIRVVTEFFMGIIVYYLYSMDSFTLSTRAYPKNLIRAIFLVSLSSLFFLVSYLWLIPLFAWLIFSIARKDINIPFLSSRVFVYLGCISYSFYLSHGVVLILWLLFWPVHEFATSSIAIKILYIFSYIAGTTVLALFVYHFIEEPARKWIIQRLNK